MSDTSFDYIIIGAGTAGCLLANRLSADPRKRVLLIEAGRKDDYHWIHIPVGYLYCIGNPRTDWLYSTEADAGLNGRTLRYPRGKTLGGSSSINGMIYMRGQSRDYDGGRSSSATRLALGQRACRPSRSTRTSTRAPTPCTAPAASGASRSSACAGTCSMPSPKAAQQAGIPHSEDFNRGSNEGVGYFQVNQKNGWRWNTAKAFLRPTCYGRPNFELWTGAQVSRLLFETLPDGTRRCTGAEVWNGSEMVHRARHARSAPVRGRIGSPQILQLSGIGPAELLRSTASTWCSTCPASAPTCRTTCRSARSTRSTASPTLNTLANSWWGKAEDRPGIRAQAQRPDEHGAVAAGRLHAQLARPCRGPTSSTTCSRSASMPSASRCTASTPSPRACATSTPPAAARCASAASASTTRRPSRPTT
jgi:choline dehydrogenase